MKKLIALLAVFIALAVLNPSMRDFREHVEEVIGDRLTSEGAGKLGELGAGAVALLAEQVSERRNYFLFSIYTIDLDGRDLHAEEWQFLGLAGMFFQLREPESVASKREDKRS